ncbi:hypothetical protein [Paraburkholderia aromaticivorans]|uniref:Uncharacterized protein n=1 Tax=Paraburkholderia aromaticivorans TaxID=2026199 RepID=A0A248VV49_9BURK|nr:hypothetical protein [Paraburkholderia aromaticivorans]ASW02847.1 hypothetical protein CJU94_32975 [Paraburkholderia aromaticivorans]
MNGGKEVNPATQRSPRQKRFYRAGMAALVAGMIAAVIIYATAPPPDSAVSLYSMADPRYQMELQRIGGNAAVLMAQFHQWFDGLWHGTALAYTVAVLGIAVAGACFFIGYFFADEAPQP